MLVLLFAVLLDLPYLHGSVLPVHDTFYSFANFYVFYSRLFFEGRLAQWFPYGTYGLPAALQQVISLSPMDHVVGLGGALLRVRDAMALFKLATIGEHLVFVLGVYALASYLFVARATAVALGIAAAGTIVWYAQLWFELRFFYLLPLVLLCVLRFLDLRRPVWLWLAGLTSVAWSMGNVPYFIPMWMLTLVLIVAPLLPRYRGEWSRLLAPTGIELLFAVAFLAAAAIYVYVGFHALDSLVIREEGRDPLTRKVDLETFRTWGGSADLGVVARSVLLGSPVHLPWGSGRDNSPYFGLLPLVGLGVALVRERSRLFWGLVVSAGALVLLSQGGVFAALVYYVPLLSEFRHVGLVYGLVKALLIVAAGYGIDRLFLASIPLRWPPGWRRLAARAIAVGTVAVVAAGWGRPTLLRLWMYAALPALSLAVARSHAWGLCAALAFDLALFQASVFSEVPRLPASVYTEAFQANPLAYQERRLGEPARDASSSERTRRALDALGEIVPPDSKLTLYWNAYDFAQFDPCRGRFFTETWTYGVDTLVRLGDEGGVPIDDLLACDAPKLRLVSGARVTDNLKRAIAWLAEPPGAAPVRDVIRLPPGHAVPRAAGIHVESPGEVRVTRFTTDELAAEASVAEPGAWLVYADAFHPGWHATLDGHDAFIAEANLAFKAVWLPPGDHRIELGYGRGAPYWASYALAAFGLIAAVGTIVLLLATLAPARTESSDSGGPPRDDIPTFDD